MNLIQKKLILKEKQKMLSCAAPEKRTLPHAGIFEVPSAETISWCVIRKNNCPASNQKEISLPGTFWKSV